MYASEHYCSPAQRYNEINIRNWFLHKCRTSVRTLDMHRTRISSDAQQNTQHHPEMARANIYVEEETRELWRSAFDPSYPDAHLVMSNTRRQIMVRAHRVSLECAPSLHKHSTQSRPSQGRNAVIIPLWGNPQLDARISLVLNWKNINIICIWAYECAGSLANL